MRRIIALFLCCLVALSAAAKITLPPQIGDNMVLQQNTKANLWGWANPGETVTVSSTWDDEVYTVKAGSDGAWKVAVYTPQGSYEDHTVVISAGKETVELKHVLIGEVWLASGQSNMEMPLRGFDGCPVEGALQEIATSGRYKGRIRFVMLPKTEAYEPQTLINAPWKESCADNAAEFSATAWFFAKNLNEVLDVPVGIICNAWGGSAVEGWIPREIVRNYSDLVSEPEDVKKIRNQMARPTIMYYGQWCPVRNYTYKGAIWYQGESNIGHPDYALRMGDMIQVWREESGISELPVYQVEIAPYISGGGVDGLESALLREQQRIAARDVENCWCVSTVDLMYPYEGTQIHPARKREVGERLSYMALNHTYGKKQFPGIAPTYDYYDVEGSNIVISFENVRQAGGFNRSEGLEGFEVCGPDLVWHPATARVQPFVNRVVVHSDDVPEPVAARYCFKNWQLGNLAGANGLAVEPFRTDRIPEGEIPGITKEPDGDFEGHWTGSTRMEQMGGREIQYDYRISKRADGTWQCSVNGEAPQNVNVRGRRLTGLTAGGGMPFPLELKLKEDGTLSVQMMGNETAVLSRRKK